MTISRSSSRPCQGRQARLRPRAEALQHSPSDCSSKSPRLLPSSARQSVPAILTRLLASHHANPSLSPSSPTNPQRIPPRPSHRLLQQHNRAAHSALEAVASSPINLDAMAIIAAHRPPFRLRSCFIPAIRVHDGDSGAIELSVAELAGEDLPWVDDCARR